MSQEYQQARSELIQVWDKHLAELSAGLQEEKNTFKENISQFPAMKQLERLSPEKAAALKQEALQDIVGELDRLISRVEAARQVPSQ